MDVGPGYERDVRTALQEMMSRLYDIEWEALDPDLVEHRIMPKITEALLALTAADAIVQRVQRGETTWSGLPESGEASEEGTTS